MCVEGYLVLGIGIIYFLEDSRLEQAQAANVTFAIFNE